MLQRIICFFLLFRHVNSIVYKFEKTLDYNLVTISSGITEMSIFIEDELQVFESTGDYAFLVSSYERMQVYPDEGHYFEKRVIDIIEDDGIIALPEPWSQASLKQYDDTHVVVDPGLRGCHYITPFHEYKSLVDIIPIGDIHNKGGLLAVCEKSDTIFAFSIFLEHTSPFSFKPVHTYLNFPIDVVLIHCPIITPYMPNEILVYRYQIFYDNEDRPSYDFIHSCKVPYVIPFASRTDKVVLDVSTSDFTVLIRDSYTISRDSHPKMINKVEEENQDEQEYVIAVIELLRDQVLPRFPDSRAAFARAFVTSTQSNKTFPSAAVEVNGVVFKMTGDTYNFLANFQTSYAIRFYLVETGWTNYAYLSAPEPGIFRFLHPISKDCRGRVVANVYSTVDYVQEDGNGMTFITVDGHRENVESVMRYEDIATDCEDVGLDIPIEYHDQLSSSEYAFFTVEAHMHEQWMDGISDELLCRGYVNIQLKIITSYNDDIHVRIDKKFYAVSDSGCVMFETMLPFDLETVDIYTQGGTFLLRQDLEIKNFLSDATSPISFSPPRPLHVKSFVSRVSPGSIKIAANVTDYTGKLVDTMDLFPGVYLATSSQNFTLQSRHVACLSRQLISVPVVSSPYPTLKASALFTKSKCPVGGPPTLYQLAVTVRPEQYKSIVLWQEKTGIVGSLNDTQASMAGSTLVVATFSHGKYQFVDVDTGEYSTAINLLPSDYDVEKDFYFLRSYSSNELYLYYPSEYEISLYITECELLIPDTKTNSTDCPMTQSDMNHRPSENSEEKVVVFSNMPYTAKFSVKISTTSLCSFTKSTSFLPHSELLPVDISYLLCETSCDGVVTVTPMFMDFHTGTNMPIPNLKNTEYQGYVEGVLLSSQNVMKFIRKNGEEFTATYVITQDKKTTIHKTQSCKPRAVPVLEPYLSAPLFCPNVSDAQISFRGLNFAGVVTHNNKSNYSTRNIKNLYINGIGPGLHTFTYTASECSGSASLYVRYKDRYDVEARLKIDTNDDKATITLIPGGEFDVFYADMFDPKDRQFVRDDGHGSPVLVDVPTGYVINITVPYPEAYFYIKNDFCEQKMQVSPGLRITESELLQYHAHQTEKKNKTNASECRKDISLYVGEPVDKTLLSGGKAFNWTTLRTTDDELTPIGIRIDYLVDSCIYSISWLLAGKKRQASRLDDLSIDVAALDEATKKRDEERIRWASLSTVTCRVIHELSCPLCKDASVMVDTNSFNEVMFIWSDNYVSSNRDKTRSGLGKGNYIISAVERGGNATLSPFCVVNLDFRHDVIEIDSLSIYESRGCGKDASAQVNMIVLNAQILATFALRKKTQSLILSCLDERFQASNSFFINTYDEYIPCVCDGAEVTCWDESRAFKYSGVVATAPKLVSVAHGCYDTVMTFSDVFGSLKETITSSSEYYFTETSLSVPVVKQKTTFIIQDERECPLIFDVDPPDEIEVSNMICEAQLRTFDQQAMMSNFSVTYDCLITSNDTVITAVEEIIWCAENQIDIVGQANAPIIDIPVIIPPRPRLSMSFLTFTSELFVGSSFFVFLDVDVSSNTTLTSAIGSFSFSTVSSAVITLPGDSNFGTVKPNQQISIQNPFPIDMLTLSFPSGLSVYLFNVAYTRIMNISIIANRTGTVQFLSTEIEFLNLFLPEASSNILFLSSNGDAFIRRLVIFLPNGKVHTSPNTTVSSNSTTVVACQYLTKYPDMILSVVGGYGGPILKDLADCAEFGGIATPSQSQSMTSMKYEPVPFPEGLTIIFSMILTALVIVAVMFLYAYFGI